ncbi:unnamed protein product [Prunus armeniaca]
MGQATFKLGWRVRVDHAVGRRGLVLVESRPGSQLQSWAKKCGWARPEELRPDQQSRIPSGRRIPRRPRILSDRRILRQPRIPSGREFLAAKMPSQKGGRGVIFKGHGAFSTIWSGVSLCKSGRVLLKDLGRPLLFQKAGPRWIFSLRTRCPLRNTWASKIRTSELKFGRRYFRRES